MTDLLRFEGVRAVQTAEVQLDFSVAGNTCVSLVGDESMGVDRLGACALGLQPLRSGTILVFDTNVSALSRRDALTFRRQVGYLPAGNGLLQNLSLRDNIALPLRFGSDFSERDIEGRLGVLLGSARLTTAARLRPAQVTDEQRRRAAVVRALAFDPKLVILEQPFDGLTNAASREIIDLARGGEVSGGSRRTVLVVGHNLPTSVQTRFERRYRVTRNGLVELN